MNQLSSFKTIAGNIVRLALVPAFFAGAGMIVLQWILMGIWLAFHYDDSTPFMITLVSVMGGVFSVIVCWIWALRRFVVRACGILHEELIRYWILEVTNRAAGKLTEAGEDTGLFKTVREILDALKNVFNEKAEKAPKIIRRLVRYITRKMGFTPDFSEKFTAIMTGDKAQISGSLEQEISKQLYGLYGKIIPGWIGYCVVFNIILLIVVWFFG